MLRTNRAFGTQLLKSGLVSRAHEHWWVRVVYAAEIG